MRRLLIIGAFLLLAPAVSATTRYVDYVGGADTNTGTSTGSPWKRAPGMQGCANNCASFTPAADDTIVLKGGVTWPNVAFTWNWTWSGTSGHPITIGVDATWYTGGSWSRPIMDAQHAAITGGGHNEFFNADNTTDVVVDNLEWKGYYWTGSPSGSDRVFMEWYQAQRCTVSHNYFHGWFHMGNSDGDVLLIVYGDTTSPYVAGCHLSYNVWDGSDSTNDETGLHGDSGAAMYAWSNADHNVITGLTNGLLGADTGGLTWNDNIVGPINQSFDAGNHENCAEPNGGGGDANPVYIYNNVFYNCTAVNVLTPGSGSPQTVYFWNNVLYQTSVAYVAGVSIDDYATAANIKFYGYNNTIYSASGTGSCFRLASRGNGPIGVFDVRNNHCIGSALYVADVPPGATAITNMNNVTSTSTSNFKTSAPSIYSPSNGSAVTVGAGADLSSLATGALASLANATTYACTYQTSDHTAACPAQVAAARSAPWDVGAYFLSGPNVTLVPTSISFGGVTVGATTGTTTVTLTNNGASTLTYSSIAKGGTDAAKFNLAAGSCVLAGSTLAASASCTFTVSFSPTAVASYSANITVTSDASTSPDSVTLSGSGVAAATTTFTLNGSTIFKGGGVLK